MPNTAADLGWVEVAGPPADIGLALGHAGRDAVHEHLLASELWRAVTSPDHALQVGRMSKAVQARFPRIWDELRGLAEGLDLPLEQVVAWNCRGDLLASVPDGCTTVLLPGTGPLLAHNEDGLPFFRGSCFIADATPDEAPGFIAFCYPGSLPGHTFAVTGAGLAQTVNNIRLAGVDATIPRMVLGRAVLAATSLEEAVSILTDDPMSGGFHFGLCHRRDRRLLSAEFGGGKVSVIEITKPSVHANHALHMQRGLAAQIVTQSSADRQARGENLVSAGTHPLALLRDKGGTGLPIRRDDVTDPDEENTLGTALLQVTDAGVRWEIHTRSEGAPVYSGTTG